MTRFQTIVIVFGASAASAVIAVFLTVAVLYEPSPANVAEAGADSSVEAPNRPGSSTEADLTAPDGEPDQASEGAERNGDAAETRASDGVSEWASIPQIKAVRARFPVDSAAWSIWEKLDSLDREIARWMFRGFPSVAGQPSFHCEIVQGRYIVDAYLWRQPMEDHISWAIFGVTDKGVGVGLWDGELQEKLMPVVRGLPITDTGVQNFRKVLGRIPDDTDDPRLKVVRLGHAVGNHRFNKWIEDHPDLLGGPHVGVVLDERWNVEVMAQTDLVQVGYDETLFVSVLTGFDSCRPPDECFEPTIGEVTHWPRWNPYDIER